MTLAWTLGCGPEGPGEPGSCTERELVVGVLAPSHLTHEVTRYELVAEQAGVQLARQSWSQLEQTSAPFPIELPLRTSSKAEIAVRFEAFRDLSFGGEGTLPGPPGLPDESISVRTALVSPNCGEKKLLRLRLEQSCMSVLGGARAPTCPSPGQTCRAGRCVDAHVDDSALEPYRTTWVSDEPDACSSPSGGAPEVALGVGQTDYLPIADGATVQLEAGPQGGHHIWLAVRMAQLKQVGTTLSLRATQPETGLTVQPMTVVFAFEPDEGGRCKIYGLRYQLDGRGDPLDRFLGKPLDLTVELRDPAGRSATATKRVQVASSVR
jgi:hypothetical protein